MSKPSHIAALAAVLLLAIGCGDRTREEVTAASPPRGVARAKLTSPTGSVTVKRATGDDWIDATDGLELYQNDTVKTGSSASALLVFANGSQVKLGPDALIGIAETRLRPGRNRTDLTVLKGQVNAELQDTTRQSLSVSTPTATVRSGREIVFQ